MPSTIGVVKSPEKTAQLKKSWIDGEMQITLGSSDIDGKFVPKFAGNNWKCVMSNNSKPRPASGMCDAGWRPASSTTTRGKVCNSAHVSRETARSAVMLTAVCQSCWIELAALGCSTPVTPSQRPTDVDVLTRNATSQQVIWLQRSLRTANGATSVILLHREPHSFEIGFFLQSAYLLCVFFFFLL